MTDQLKGKRVAALVANGFEQIELHEPRRVLESEGAVVEVVSPEPNLVRGWNHREWGEEVSVDRALDQACPEDYDALLLPGGVMSPDRLRTNPHAVHLVKLFFDSGKPIAVICHGPWTLIEADVVRGVKMTSYPSVRTDLKNAGAHWVDEEVVVDQGIVSSRSPADLPAFTRRMVEAFDEGLLGPHARQPRVRAAEKAAGVGQIAVASGAR
jgi:protease I